MADKKKNKRKKPSKTLAILKSKLLGVKVMFWKSLNNWYYEKFYEYRTQTEPQFLANVGIASAYLDFPLDRERIYYLLNGEVVAVFEGASDYVTTPGNVLQALNKLAKYGNHIEAIHNHPRTKPNPSEADIVMAEKYPLFFHTIIAIDNKERFGYKINRYHKPESDAKQEN